MSVGVYRIEYHLLSFGRAEANWLCNHFDHTPRGEGTIVHVRKDDLAERLKEARACSGCEFFGEDSSFEATMKEHRHLDKTMPAILRALMKENAEEKDWVDIDINW